MDYISSVLTAFPAAHSFNPDEPAEEDRAIRSYISALSGLGDTLREAVLAKPEYHLRLLDPSANSIGYLAVLEPLIATISPASSSNHPSSSVDRNVVLDATVDFLTQFDSRHIRYVGSLLLSVLEYVASGNAFSSLVTVELLSTVLLRIDPAGSMFTSIHPTLATLAYESDYIDPVLEVIDRDITSYPTLSRPKDSRPLCDASLSPSVFITVSSGMTRGIKANTVLEYNFVCGLIYTSCHQWGKAVKAFERVVTHPSKDKGVSKIMTEAYKRWMLVSLLYYGHAPTIPPYTSQSAKAIYTNISAPYTSIAQLFASSDAEKLRHEAESNRPIWEEAANQSLIDQVLSAYQQWQIINMRKVYTQISVSQIAVSTSSAVVNSPQTTEDDVVTLIEGMIESGMLKGELHTAEDGAYLKFHADHDRLTEQDFARQIAQSHLIISSVGKEYQLVNDYLSGNREYVNHVVREQKRFDKEEEDPTGSFESQIEDEDLMTGIIATG
ncbi:COP9 signalosome complex subunit 3 [Geosmithia morbida]|uniref:COP9 signalosome complex subunit 3 n=1 Tax=Geosmithia morbida TaxID=1094350 RepID=A0A9P4Z125_9HYPO|nr:COP9 signalosome complex subunit 3 [Geosmithia morbida]KAF4125740.1 COP9 signalosome complex subunit 3 [Geosmithia morbida]